MQLITRVEYLQKIAIFRNRHPLIGPIFWLLSLQYFVTQWSVSQAWLVAYSLAHNTISDLGNTKCAMFAGRAVCSPQHNAMNASFIVLGISMILGAFFIPNEFRKSLLSRIGFWFMALAGIGTILVGAFPENSIRDMHILGATLPFLLGNVALILFSFSLQLPPGFRYYTRFSGIIALSALVLFAFKQYLGLGIGGMERLIAYPQTVWLIAFGWYMSFNHFRQIRDGTIDYS